MATIRARVNCFRCGIPVHKAETILIKTLTNEKKYECYSCYKGGKMSTWGGKKTKVKQELYCQRCKYKFRSKTSLCPYCNKDDFVTFSNVKIEDLI